jgi:hypothetical protein
MLTTQTHTAVLSFGHICNYSLKTLHTQPGVTYAQITTQTSYAATNIEQDEHIYQNSSFQGLASIQMKRT